MIRCVSQHNSEISSAWHVEVLIILSHVFSQVAVVLMSIAFGLNRDVMQLSCSQHSEQCSRSHWGSCCGRTNTWALFFHGAGSGSVQPFNQKAIRGGASGEDYPNLRLIPALNRSISSPLKITSKTQEGEITKGTRCHLSDTPLSCLPDCQVSPDLLFWHHPGNIFLGFVLVVTLHANFNKRLNKRQVQQLSFFVRNNSITENNKTFFFLNLKKIAELVLTR